MSSELFTQTLRTGLVGVALSWSGLLAQTVFAQGTRPAVLPTSELPIVLIGVSVNDATPSESVCMIRCTSAGKDTPIFKAGQKACEVAEVAEIRQDAVVVKNLLSGRLELLKIRNAGRSPGAPVPPLAEPIAPPMVRSSADSVNVTLPKASVEHYLLNLSDLLTSALATPHLGVQVNGQRSVDGFELQQIKPGSVIEQLGLKNGDVIAEVNGETLDSLATVMRIFAQVQTSPEASMTVVRAGKKLTFQFRLK